MKESIASVRVLPDVNQLRHLARGSLCKKRTHTYCVFLLPVIISRQQMAHVGKLMAPSLIICLGNSHSNVWISHSQKGIVAIFWQVTAKAF